MKSKTALLALGIGVYLAVVIASFPAAVAQRWFAPPELRLAGVDGTVWRGSAAYGGVGDFSFSDFRWQLHPAALLTGRLSVTAEARLVDGFVSGTVTASASQVELRSVQAATSLASYRELLGFGDISGQLSVELQSLELVDGFPVSAAGEARIAGLSAPPLFMLPGVSTIPLGNYRAQFTASDQPGIVAVLNDQGGPLEVSGRLSLTPDRRWAFDSLITPRADAIDELVQGLNVMSGAPNADGQYKFVQQGSI